MTAPTLGYYWHDSDGRHSDRFSAEDTYEHETDPSSFGHFDYPQNYSLSAENGSSGSYRDSFVHERIIDERVALAAGDRPWSPNEDRDCTNGNLDMETSGSFDEPFMMDNMKLALPQNTSRSPKSYKPSLKRNGTTRHDDTCVGDIIDDEFTKAFADEDIVWRRGGRMRGSAKPSQANKCLRASERINERIAKSTSQQKSSRTTISSSKSNTKSHSKGGHSSHNKNKSSRK